MSIIPPNHVAPGPFFIDGYRPQRDSSSSITSFWQNCPSFRKKPVIS